MPIKPLTPEALASLRAISHQRRQVAPPDLTPEEQRSLLGQTLGALDYVGGTLDKPGAAVRGVIGGALDLAAGREPEWGGGPLNLIPFSDTLGITDREDRVSGRDVLEKLGAPENKPGLGLHGFNPANWDWENLGWDLGGFAAEVALDPLTYATGPLGSVVKGSKAAEAAAPGIARHVDDLAGAFDDFTRVAEKGATVPITKTPVQLAKEIREGQRGLVGLRLPFAHEAFATLGAGSERAAKAVEALAYGGKWNPFVAGRAVFSPVVHGKWEGAAQRAVDLAFGEHQRLLGAARDMAPHLFKRESDLFAKYVDIAKHFQANGNYTHGFNDFTRYVIETPGALPSSDGIVQALKHSMGKDSANLAEVIDNVNGLGDSFHEYFDVLRDVKDRVWGDHLALGGKGGLLEDMFAAHFSRGVAKSVKEGDTIQMGREAMKSWIAREQYLRNYPGRTPGLNVISRDPQLAATYGHMDKAAQAGLKKSLKEENVRFVSKKRFAERLEEFPDEPIWERSMRNDASATALQERLMWERHTKRHIDEAILDPDARFAEYERWWTPDESGETPIRQLTTNMSRLPEDVLNNGLFDKSLANDFYNYVESVVDKTADLASAHELLNTPGVVRTIDEAVTGDVSLAKAWDKAGFSRRGLYKHLLDKHKPDFDPGEWTAMQDALRQGVSSEAFEGMFGDTSKQIVEMAKNMAVSEQVSGSLKALGELQKPYPKGKILETFDKVTAFFKGALTVPFPAFHSRNLLSGMWQSWSDGRISLSELLAGYRDAISHVNGKGTLEYIDEIKQLDILGAHSWLVELEGPQAIGHLSKVPSGFMGGIFNVHQPGRAWKDALNPLNVRGVRDHAKELLAPGAGGAQNVLMEFGDKAYAYVEFLNRGGYYNALRKKGFSPSQAAYYVKRSQFDYQELSAIDKSVMRRIFPFWSWSRKSVPYTLQKLLERPGGKTAQTIRAFTSGSDDLKEGSYKPRFLREYISATAGGPPEATSFMKQAGIPIEDLNKLVLEAGLPSKRTFQKFMAEGHPLAVYGMEALSGLQLYTGRPLKHLESVTERVTGRKMPRVDLALAHSPVSRVITEASSLTHPNKTWWQKLANVATGLKFSTYDTEKWRAIDLADAQRRVLERTPEIRTGGYYYPDPKYRGTPKYDELEKDTKLLRSLDRVVKDLMAEKRGD